MDGDPLERRVLTEAACRAYQLGQRLSLFQLVDSGPRHRAGDLGTLAAQRHVHHVPGLEAEIAALIAAQQVVVQVQGGGDLVEPQDLDAAHVGARGDPAGGVQRGERRPQGADLVRAGLLHLADHVHLVHAHIGD